LQKLLKVENSAETAARLIDMPQGVLRLPFWNRKNVERLRGAIRFIALQGAETLYEELMNLPFRQCRAGMSQGL